MSKATKEQTPPRLRLASTIDLSKAKKSCKRCHGTGVRGKRIIDDPENPGTPVGVPLICRCVTRGGGVQEDTLDKMAKEMQRQLETGQFAETMAGDIMGLPDPEQRIKAMTSLESFAMDDTKSAQARKAAFDALDLIRERMRQEARYGHA